MRVAAMDSRRPVFLSEREGRTLKPDAEVRYSKCNSCSPGMVSGLQLLRLTRKKAARGSAPRTLISARSRHRGEFHPVRRMMSVVDIAGRSALVRMPFEPYSAVRDRGAAE